MLKCQCLVYWSKHVQSLISGCFDARGVRPGPCHIKLTGHQRANGEADANGAVPPGTHAAGRGVFLGFTWSLYTVSWIFWWIFWTFQKGWDSIIFNTQLTATSLQCTLMSLENPPMGRCSPVLTSGWSQEKPKNHEVKMMISWWNGIWWDLMIAGQEKMVKSVDCCCDFMLINSDFNYTDCDFYLLVMLSMWPWKMWPKWVHMAHFVRWFTVFRTCFPTVM